MTQIQEIELVELDEVADEDVACEPWNIGCGKPATWWYIFSCCGKKFPFCDSHCKKADAEAIMWMGQCSMCGTPCSSTTYIKIPIGRA